MTAEHAGAQRGMLASPAGADLPLQVLRSAAGFYIGTWDPAEGPFSRESVEYWPARPAAERAFAEGHWTQRLSP
jgi:hypothetical protein